MGRPSKYPVEFRESAVAQVPRDRVVNEGTVSNGVLADRRARGEQSDDLVSETERVELVRLRREIAQARMEREILRNAAPSS